MASNPQTIQPFGRPLPNSSNFFSQRDREQQLYGLFSGLNLNSERHHQPSTPVPATETPPDDIELNDVRPNEKKLTTKQLRKQRAAEESAKAAKKPKVTHVHKAKKQNRAKIRFERRKSQKDRLDAINRDPQLIERRLQAWKKLHACAQDLNNATENKAALKQTLRNLTEALASHTEKTAEELYAELCQTNNQKSVEVLIEGQIKGAKKLDKPFDSFSEDLRGPEPVPTSQISKQQKEKIRRRKEVSVNIAQPTFKLLAPSRDQKIRNSQNWKRAKPLIIDLRNAIESGRDIAIVQSYTAARIPIKNLAEGLERKFEEIISEVIPALTRDRIAYFEQPFITLEETR